MWVLKITLRIFSIIVQKFQVIFNTYKNNEKIIPSAMGQQRRQVCDFLFAHWDASDCFYDGLMPQTFLELSDFQYQRMFYEIAMASGHRENNYFDSLWQIKNHTLAGFS